MLNLAAYNSYVLYSLKNENFKSNNRHRRICLQDLSISLMMPLITTRANKINEVNFKHYHSSVVNAIRSIGVVFSD